MAKETDYDAPRSSEGDSKNDSLEVIQAQNPGRRASADAEDETGEDFELPGADLSNEELVVRIIPPQKDEFTCSTCFLVHHRSQIASQHDGIFTCTECAEQDAGSRKPTRTAPRQSR